MKLGARPGKANNFRLLETKDRTFEELDILFIRGVKSRHFAEANMDSDEDYTNTD